jgi:ubiquinone/menaquinone biosynthesis C-methylase UbiE
MNQIEEKQKRRIKYYDKFSSVYDFLAGKFFYHKARSLAVKELYLTQGQTVLNLPCGTGQNFEYFQKYLANTGKIIGIDLSDGMLQKGQKKINKNNWSNIIIKKDDARRINQEWIHQEVSEDLKTDAILCDLGLSCFPDWENIIDNLISILRPNGRIVIMDCYIEKQSLRTYFLKWIGKGEVDRPISQYLKTKIENFKIDRSFLRGAIFVASGTKLK